MKSKVVASIVFAASLVGSRAVHAEVINHVTESYNGFYDQCFQYLGSPQMQSCAVNYWQATYYYLLGRYDGYALQAAYMCPQGEFTSPECADIYASWNSCAEAGPIASAQWQYWANL